MNTGETVYNKNPLLSCFVLAGLLILSGVSGTEAFAQTTLPPKAQKAMTRGMAAAEQQEWDLAIKYFSEAQEAAPTSPRALFNLALAYYSAGDHEVSAVIFFRA